MYGANSFLENICSALEQSCQGSSVELLNLRFHIEI